MVNRQHILLAAISTMLCMSLSNRADAQAGISVEAGTQQGLIGSSKPNVDRVACPAGTLPSGVLHVDIRMDIPISEAAYNGRGLTGEASLYCSRVSTDGTNVTVQQTTANGTPAVASFQYSRADTATAQNAYCAAGGVAHQFGGWERISQAPDPWVSAVRMVCRPLSLNANDWVRVDTAAAAVNRDAGNLENDVAPHVLRGPFCNGGATTVVSGIDLQRGGVGYDGLAVTCGGLQQARFSAVMTFTDFAWNQTRGGSGWLVNLQRGGTTLNDGGNNNGAGRTPHATAAANINEFQANREIYVVPNSGYTAQVSQRPTGIAANTHVVTGTCATGITLGNEADSSCTLNVRGLPDIGVGITTTPLTYNSYGPTQNFTVTGTNYGPGAVGAGDGFTLRTTLPTGWTATAVTGCTVAGQVVTCAITSAIAAASSPGAAGGTVSFTFPVRVNAPTASGSFTANLALGRSASNNDYNTANDTASGTLILALPARLTINKTLPNGRMIAADQFTLSIVGAGAPAAVTTTGSGSTATGTVTHATATPATTYTLSETGAASTNLASYTTAYSCTNARAGGQTLSGSGTTFSVTPVAGDDLTCTFTNTAPSSTPLTCDATLYLTQTGGVLHTINRASNPFTYPTLGAAGTSINALAYNPADNHLYALRSLATDEGRRLYRIDASGTRTDLGLVSGLPVPGTGNAYFAGAFTTAGDNAMYVTDGVNDNRMYRIDVTTMQATVITLSRNLYVADFDYANGLFYGVETNSGQLVSIHPVNGTVTNIGSPGTPGVIAGVWADSVGLYGLLNAGGFYRFDMVTGARTLISDSPAATSSDGARCPLGPALTFNADLAITKTDGATTYTPGTNVVYTIVASNNGPFGALNARVQDALPSGITTASWTCVAANGAACRTASGTGAIDARVDLPVGGTATFTLTMAVPTTFSGALTNTATIAVAPGNTDSITTNNSASDTNQRAPRVTIAKTSVGGVGTFNFTGSNGLAAQAITTVTAGIAVSGTTQYLNAASTTTTITEAAPPAGFELTGISCTGLPAGGTATPNLATRTVTLNAAATAVNADVTCTFTNTRQTTLRLQKSLPNGRVIAGNQFTLSIAGTGAPAAVTTSGSGGTVTETVTHASATAGSSYTLSESAAGSTVLANYTTTYSCTNARAGGQAPSGSGTSFSVTPVGGDDLTCTFVNTAPSSTPLACDATLYLTQSGGVLYTVNRSSNPFTYPTLGTPSVGLNALGYNPADNYLYALRTASGDDGRRLYRIDASGTRIELGLVSGLPAPSAGDAYYAGAFTTAGDNALYVTDGLPNNRMYRIDVTTLQATLITLSRNLYVADFDYIGGLFYGIEANTGQLVSISPDNGVVRNIGSPGPVGVIGAIWADGVGLYGVLNAGGFYRFDAVTGARTLISDSPAASSSDGALCPLGPALTFNADLAITKTDGATTYRPGTNVVYTIVASNNGPFGAQNARVQDALPSGITTASWTCVAANGAACRTASGTGVIDALVDLPVGGTATFTLTMAVPTTFSGALTNTATIAVAPGNTDSITTNNSATDTNQRAPRVTIAKTSVGGVGTFNFTGSNGLSAQAITTVTAGTAVSGATQYLSAASTITTITEAAPPAGFELAGISCSGLPAGGSATPNLATRTVTLDAAATAGNADVTCTFTNTRQATLRLQKSLPNGRVVAGNQFTLSITGTGAPAAVTTTGTGTTVNGTVTHNSATAGSVYTLSEAAAGSPATVLANYTTTYSCTNARAGGQTPSGSGTSFTVTPVGGDDLTCTFTNTAPAPNPLACDATLYLTQFGGVLYTVNRSSNPFTYPTLGSPSVALNAMGYNPADNYLYAVRALSGDDGRRLYRVDASGRRIELGLVNGLPAPPTGISYFAGAFTTAGDNVLYVMDNLNLNRMYRIDVTTLQATLITLSRNLYVADFDYIGGLFYGVEVSTGQLVSIDPVSGAVTDIGSPVPIGTFGAIWADNLGLYGALNEGGFYRLDTVTGARTLISDSPAAAASDGARCTTGPALTFNADLAITKTNTPAQGVNDLADDTYAPGESRTYTIVVTNNGPFGAQNVTVSDPLPTGITTASWTCTSTSGNAVCGAASGTNAINDTGLDLPANAVATYTLTFTVPASFTGTLTNVANVAAGTGTTDPTSGNNSATDADTRAPQLTLAKSWITARINDAATITATGTPSPVGSGALNAVANTATETDTATGRYSLQRGQSYTITEAFTVGNAASYAKSLSCTGNTGTGAALAYTANALSGTLTVGSTATDITCTFANSGRATLTLRKTVTNDNGGTQDASAWTLTASGPTNISGATGTPAVTNAAVNPGTYTLAESATPTGYTASLYSCVKNGAAAVSGNSLVLAAGDTATCTITNDDQPARLTLTKTVINDNGGTQPASAWTLSAAGPTNISGTTGNPAVTNAAVNPGTYTLAESATPLHYVASPYSCIKNGGAPVSGNSLVLAAGDTATCTINNNDSNEADLSITKTNDRSVLMSGQVTTYTLVVRNGGPASANGAVIRDPAPTNMVCTAVSCGSATGGAVCPAVNMAALQSTAGVTVATLPANSSLTLTLTCTVN